eukprot:4676871-Ditylum_brightwellii.AAC.1
MDVNEEDSIASTSSQNTTNKMTKYYACLGAKLKTEKHTRRTPGGSANLKILSITLKAPY